MGKQIGKTTGAKVICSDCGMVWIEGKTYNNRQVVLRHLKNKEDFYMSLDNTVKTYPSAKEGQKSIVHCPQCETTAWELRVQTSRKTWSKSKQRQEELGKKYRCFLYTRLFCGAEIQLLIENSTLRYTPDGEFILTRYNKKGSVHSRVTIPIMQAVMRVKRLTEAKLEEDNVVERAVNTHVLLKKMSLHGEL